MSKARKAFFAYPGEPAEIGSTIKRAVETVSTSKVRVTPWPQLPVFGAVIPEEIREAIQQNEYAFFDVTYQNPNVYYELGYAIGLGKRVGPVLNASYDGAARRIQQQGIFDNLGYKSYDNSDELKAILQSSPLRSLNQLYAKEVDFRQPLFLLDTLKKTDFRNSIVSAIKASRVFYRSFDPVETARVSTVQMIGDITASSGIIIPLLGSHIVDFEVHNLRAAFVAGLCHGLGRNTLILKLQTEGTSDPADYRDNIVPVKDPKDILTRVRKFAQDSLLAAQSIEPSQQGGSTSALRAISLGAVAAENEFRTLSQYFVETSEFERTVRGEVKVVTGRKGSGKSAIFFRARDLLRRKDDNFVIDLKPESYQLTRFRDALSQIEENGLVDHTLGAFWHFVILCEMLIAIRKEAEGRIRASSEAVEIVRESEEILGEFSVLEAGDFTSRLNQLSRYFLQEISALNALSLADTLKRLTNIIYTKGISKVRDAIVRRTLIDTNFVVLFDNIDKGWPAAGVEPLDVKIVRLLLESLTKIGQEMASRGRQFQSTVFLRNDIFELLLSETSDRGKSARVNIDWTDREKLRQVILRRLQASHGGAGLSFEQLWYTRFPGKVEGVASFEYFLDHCLMRPRFLISIIELSIGNAVNRGHAKVSDADCIDAVKQHAYSLLDDFGYEIRDVAKVSADLFYAFVGAPKTLSSTAIVERLKKIGMTAEDAEEAFQLLLWYGALGVRSGNNTTYIYDVDYKMKRLQAEMRREDYEDLFEFNPAIYVALQ